MYARAARMYKTVDVASAPKTHVLDRLYGRCLSDIATASDAIERGDIAGRAAAIDHAFRIVVELRAALDEAAAPELTANLVALYTFALDELTAANLESNPEPLAHAAEVIGHLRESFRSATGL